MRLRTFFVVSAMAAASALAACSEIGSPSSQAGSDPRAAFEAASLETPISLVAGLYEVRLGGATLLELKSGSRTHEVCLNSYDAMQFPKDPLSWTAETWENCSSELDAPKGNGMSGARVCLERNMPMTARYTGTHDTETFSIDGVIKQGSGENESVMHLGSGNFIISGKRVGDCSL